MKELTIKVVIKDNEILSIMKKSGFNGTIDSDFEIIGILSKLLRTAQTRLDSKIEEKNHINIKKNKNAN